jgi:NAD(P)-dependent dehydrogenase (short-subunit alcohol dehydrogenase family)
MNRIENKVAIVTGGTQGLGAAIAWQFAQAGAKAIRLHLQRLTMLWPFSTKHRRGSL